jgi:transposase
MKNEPINTCPCCGEIKPLALLKTSDGREWINSACPPCGMAMNDIDQWTFYAGEK